MNRTNKEKIAFIVHQVFDLNIKDNPIGYDEKFIDWCKENKFRLRNQITNACCKLSLPINTKDIGVILNEKFDEFKQQYDDIKS